MPDPSRHADSRSAVESLMRSIPGFKGYFEREDRRESDQLARTWMTNQLQQCKGALDQWQQSLSDSGQIDLLPQCERLRSRIDLLQSRLKGAMRGYSGFFDFVRVDAEALDEVYRLDVVLMVDVTVLLQTCQELAKQAGQESELVAKLSNQLDEFARSFDNRSEILEGLNK